MVDKKINSFQSRACTKQMLIHVLPIVSFEIAITRLMKMNQNRHYFTQDQSREWPLLTSQPNSFAFSHLLSH